jgi:hypothetical protein
MRDHPTGEELLIIARTVLREELMPLLPDERRYDALMVANAMAIAARQIAFGDAPERRERQSLAGLLGEPVDGDGAMAGSAAVGDLTRRLSAEIRGGAFDPSTPRHGAAHSFLLDVTVQKLRESAPKTLEAAGMA